MCGWHLHRRTVRQAIQRETLRSDVNDKVNFVEFPKVLMRLCGGDPNQAWAHLEAMVDRTPEDGHVPVTAEDVVLSPREHSDTISLTEAAAQSVRRAKKGELVPGSRIVSRRQRSKYRFVAVSVSASVATRMCEHVHVCVAVRARVSSARVPVSVLAKPHDVVLPSMLLSGPVIAGACVVVWLVVGITFYTRHNGWRADQAFYYLIQSGTCGAPSVHRTRCHLQSCSHPRAAVRQRQRQRRAIHWVWCTQ